jgi:ABC-type transporter Mla maintaining outer membrane lipid asymmetry permease subunit MlaE
MAESQSARLARARKLTPVANALLLIGGAAAATALVIGAFKDNVQIASIGTVLLTGIITISIWGHWGNFRPTSLDRT